MARSGEPKTSVRRLAAIEKQRLALEFRMAGVPFRDIAQRLGYGGPAGAFKAVQSAIKATLQEPANEVRRLEDQRLDKLLSVWWPRMLAGEAEAAEKVLAVMKRRAALLGLDAPIKKEVGNLDGEPFKVYGGFDPDDV
jgi:hypothetical protein